MGIQSKITPQTKEDLAQAFVAELTEILTPEQLSEVATLNRHEGRKAICHTHDYCDANLCMQAASEKLGFGSPVKGNLSPTARGLLLQTWNGAWFRSKELIDARYGITATPESPRP